MTFRNSILAGMTLIREAIQSQNFQSGVAGWQIAADGTAEFSDLTIRSSDGSGNTVTVANGQIVIRNSSNVVVVEIDSDGYRLYRADGELVADLKLDVGGNLGGLYTRGFQSPHHIYSFLSGGALTLGPADNTLADVHAFVQYMLDTTMPNPYSVATISSGAQDIALDDEARVQLISQRGQNSKVWVDGGSAAVRADLEVTGGLTLGATDWTAYTPVVAGVGAGTFAFRDGWYYKLGKLVYVEATWTMTLAGTGAVGVTVSLPSTPYRAAASRRQTIPGGVTGSAAPGPITGFVFAGGAGAQLDGLVNSAGVAVTGATLAAGSVWTLNGWYREV